MDDEAEIGQVNAAGGDIGGHADPGAPVAQRLQGIAALVLGQLARERHHREAALHQAGMQVPYRLTGVAEHHGAAALVEAQHVHDPMLDFVGGDPERAVLDVAMRLVLDQRVDAVCVALIAPRQGDDVLRQGRGEQEGAAILRRGVENEFQVFAEAEIEHLVGLVEHDHAHLRGVEAPALQMVAQAARRADHDVAAIGQRPLLPAHIHAADAGDDPGTRRAIEPDQLPVDLEGQLTGRRDDEGEGLPGRTEALLLAEKGRGHGQAVGDRLSRPGLGRHEKVAVERIGLEHGGLDGSGIVIAPVGKGAFEAWMGLGKGHRVWLNRF
jgi:hypothetical protein